MRKIISVTILVLVVFNSCNNKNGKSHSSKLKINHASLQNNDNTINADNIIGVWGSGSIQQYKINEITISKISYKHYKEVDYCTDGSIYTTYLRLDDSGKYQTDNEYGEYYELSGNTLTLYDNDGLIYSAIKIK